MTNFTAKNIEVRSNGAVDHKVGPLSYRKVGQIEMNEAGRRFFHGVCVTRQFHTSEISAVCADILNNLES